MSYKEAIARYLLQSGEKTLSPKAVLFDMDGVLYDSMPFHARAWKEIADKYHLTANEEDFYLYEGRTGASTINELFQISFGRDATDEEKHRLYEEKAERFRAYNDGEAMRGTAEVLQQVKKHGMQRVVVTGSGQLSLVDKLNHTYPGMFEREKIVTAYDVKYGKPDPEPYLIGLQKAGVKANEAFVVENAPMGIKAGVAAGIFTIAVNTGPLSDQVLLDAGAHLLFPCMTALAECFDKLISETNAF